MFRPHQKHADCHLCCRDLSARQGIGADSSEEFACELENHRVCAGVFGPSGRYRSAHGMMFGVLTATQGSNTKGLSGCRVKGVLQSHLLGWIGSCCMTFFWLYLTTCSFAVAVMRVCYQRCWQPCKAQLSRACLPAVWMPHSQLSLRSRSAVQLRSKLEVCIPFIRHSRILYIPVVILVCHQCSISQPSQGCSYPPQ